MNELVWLPENRALKGCAVAPRIGKFTKANCAVFYVRYSKEVALINSESSLLCSF